MAEHRALVSLKVHSDNGLELLRQTLRNTFEPGNVLALSSIYKIFGEQHRPLHVHDLRSLTRYQGLCAVAQLRVMTPAQKLLIHLMSAEERQAKDSSHHRVSLNLLTYDDQVSMNPQLTLPHPELHTQPYYMIPAAEIWADYRHPILNKSFHELAQELARQPWGEFFAQGKSLLDF